MPNEMIFSISANSNGSGSYQGSGIDVTNYTNGGASTSIPDIVFSIYKKFTVSGTGSACGKSAGTYNVSQATNHTLSVSWNGPATSTNTSYGSASCSVKFHN